jgi:hypothetical protein
MYNRSSLSVRISVPNGVRAVSTADVGYAREYSLVMKVRLYSADLALA